MMYRTVLSLSLINSSERKMYSSEDETEEIHTYYHPITNQLKTRGISLSSTSVLDFALERVFLAYQCDLTLPELHKQISEIHESLSLTPDEQSKFVQFIQDEELGLEFRDRGEKSMTAVK
jgi:hypothetical protein